MRTIVLLGEEQRERAMQAIAALNLDVEPPWAIYIDRHEKVRNLEQNALLWALYKEIGDSTGNTKGALHQYCKERFLGKEYETVNGKVMEFTRDSKSLTVAEFSAFVTQVQQWAAEEMGI